MDFLFVKIAGLRYWVLILPVNLGLPGRLDRMERNHTGRRKYRGTRTGRNQRTTQEQPEPAAFYTKSALVTVEDVVAFGNGPGTDALAGVVESTEVFEILRDEL